MKLVVMERAGVCVVLKLEGVVHEGEISGTWIAFEFITMDLERDYTSTQHKDWYSLCVACSDTEVLID